MDAYLHIIGGLTKTSNLLIFCYNIINWLINMKNEINFIDVYVNESVKIPVFLEGVRAGFPSPAEDYAKETLNLNELLIKNPISTFFVRVKGDSMIDRGIKEGDLLIVDRSKVWKNNDVVIAVFNGGFTVKTLEIEGNNVALVPANKNMAKIEFKDGEELEIWGVVTNVIHTL